jgi:glycine cleavage system H lipoate-binding protein
MDGLDILWTRREGSRVRIGLKRAFVATEPVAFVEIAPVGTVLQRGAALALVERAHGRELELESPVAGRLVEVNRQVHAAGDASLLNAEPEGAGWLALIEP